MRPAWFDQPWNTAFRRTVTEQQDLNLAFMLSNCGRRKKADHAQSNKDLEGRVFETKGRQVFHILFHVEREFRQDWGARIRTAG